MRRTWGWAALVLAAVWGSACAPAHTGLIPVPATNPSAGDDQPNARFSRAVSALDHAEFAVARPDLEWLVGHCEAGAAGRSALLLLASADLDLANRDGSPAEAALLARAYLLLPDGDRSTEENGELPLARSLYLLASDASEIPPAAGGATARAAAGAAPRNRPTSSRAPQITIARQFDHCDAPQPPNPARALPKPAATTPAWRVSMLHSALAEATDSLKAAQRRLADQTDKIHALEAEIARIQKLLIAGGGMEPPLFQ